MPRAVTTRGGRQLDEAAVEDLARRADEGFDLEGWTRRAGRPQLAGPHGSGRARHSPRLAVRVPEDLYRSALERAADEGKSISEVIRDSLAAYLAGPVDRTPAARSEPPGGDRW